MCDSRVPSLIRWNWLLLSGQIEMGEERLRNPLGMSLGRVVGGSRIEGSRIKAKRRQIMSLRHQIQILQSVDFRKCLQCLCLTSESVDFPKAISLLLVLHDDRDYPPGRSSGRGGVEKGVEWGSSGFPPVPMDLKVESRSGKKQEKDFSSRRCADRLIKFSSFRSSSKRPSSRGLIDESRGESARDSW